MDYTNRGSLKQNFPQGNTKNVDTHLLPHMTFIM